MVEREVKGRIVAVDYRATSKSGNPTFRVTLTDGREWLTATDAGVGFAAENYAPGATPRKEENTLIVVGGRIVRIEGPDRGEEEGLK